MYKLCRLRLEGTGTGTGTGTNLLCTVIGTYIGCTPCLGTALIAARRRPFLKNFVDFAENRAGPSNIGNVISQILLCKQIAPDFNQEEICSIAKDSQELTRIIQEIQEFLPQQDLNAGNHIR